MTFPKNPELINMLKQQLRTGDVLNERILALYEELPRNAFVPEEFCKFAYSDMQIPLSHGQRMMTPLEEACILQALDLQGHERVLEIGTGCGFLSALLSRLCASLLSIDYFESFTREAAIKLKHYACDNVELIHGDAARGWLAKAPYDVVIISAPIKKITQSYLLEVMPGGKLFALIGTSLLAKAVLYTQDFDENWHKTFLFESSLPSLIDKSNHKEFIF